jgi:putative ATPase
MQPLAETLRPKTLGTYIGQTHLIGTDGVLRKAIETDHIHSMIFWGPPGVGKTTLALLIAELTGADFYSLSAVSAGVKDIREVIDKAEKSENKSILFIDEIHRFSKSQQDSLLNAVEKGIVTLMGATTENPSFEIISPLLSRCQVYVLKNLERTELEKIIETARLHLEQQLNITIEMTETEALLMISGGDARKLLNAIELASIYLPVEEGKMYFSNEAVTKIIQKKLVIYDKKGENHYDIISAFIKSLRGSDPNAAVYWLARMLSAGEDPLFIARRMIILASEDIGNANPNALLLANNCFQAVHQIGMPEARIILSQTAVYLASSPKSNASYMAIEEAINWVQKTGDLPVPLHLRNAPTKLMKDLNYGKNYQYAHDHEHNFVEQEFLPESISGKKFFEPQNNPRENELRKYLKNLWKNKYQYIILLLISLSSFLYGFSQDHHYSQFYVEPMNINPSLTAVYDGLFRVGVHHRSQWLAVSKPFSTFSCFADAPVYKNDRRGELFGLGIHFLTDKAGDAQYRSFQGALSASYLKSLDAHRKWKWLLGVYLSINQRDLLIDKLYFDEQFRNSYFDPNNPVSDVVPSSVYLYFDWGTGTALSFAPSRNQIFSIGLSISHLNRPKQSLLEESAKMNMKWTAYLSMKWECGKNFLLQPSIYTAFQGTAMEWIGGTNFEYIFKEHAYSDGVTIGAGAFYRLKDAFILNALVEIKNIRFIFGYDVNLSSFAPATHNRGGFELSLVYTFKRKTIRKIGKEPCPFEVL